MATRIRLQRHGRSKRPFYYIVVSDSRARRDGKFIDRIGDYNPLTVPATINLNFDKAFEWVMSGAQPTETCSRILSYKGVLYKKHLARGVRKGALTPEEMETKMQEWLEAKTAKIAAKVDKLNSEKQAEKAKRLADEKVKKEAYAAALIAQETPAEEEVAEEVATEETVEENTANVESSESIEEAPAAEEVAEEAPAAEEVAEEAPAAEETSDETPAE
jgi:small subunit ribosomal protein S16